MLNQEPLLAPMAFVKSVRLTLAKSKVASVIVAPANELRSTFARRKSEF